MNPETSKVWHPLRAELERRGVWHKRIETSGETMPDLVIGKTVDGVQWPGRVVWVELKRPVSRGRRVNVGLMAHQVAFLHNARAAGQLVAVVARVVVPKESDLWLAWGGVDFDFRRLAVPGNLDELIRDGLSGGPLIGPAHVIDLLTRFF